MFQCYSADKNFQTQGQVVTIMKFARVTFKGTLDAFRLNYMGFQSKDMSALNVVKTTAGDKKLSLK